MEYIINLDDELEKLIHVCGDWTYLILFVVVFCETGLVILPFLPGDSLLFIVGALAAHGLPIDIWIASIVLTGAAIIGDTVNYHIGSAIGPNIFKKENVKIFNRRHLIRAHEFYEKHGGKTIVLARFIPVVRTFVPFVAGIGKMGYLRFIIFNIAGAIGWVALFVAAGYFFGNIPFIKDNFSYVIIAIVVISVLPIIISYFRNRKKEKERKKAVKAASDEASK